jgi:hypothetical protein
MARVLGITALALVRDAVGLFGPPIRSVLGNAFHEVGRNACVTSRFHLLLNLWMHTALPQHLLQPAPLLDDSENANEYSLFL